MFKKLTYAAGVLFVTQITVAVASEEVPAVAPEALHDSRGEHSQAQMEKCFALPDARPKECAADPDSDECKAAEEKDKDGTEIKYVPRGACAKLGGSPVMAVRPKPQT